MKSASIQRILDIQPIPGADKIEVATVMGWQVVTAKENNFKVNDLILYVEIDSVVPDHPEFEFLRDRNFRVRTIKLRGQVSQGLILPLDVLSKFNVSDYMHIVGLGDDAIGRDVSEIIGAVHYEKPLPLELTGMAFGSFPGFLHKTDEVLVQSNMVLLDRLWGLPYYITVKVDGMSSTFFKTVEKFGVCSRNLELKEHENNVFWKLARKYGLDTIREGVYIQGEIAGPGIQKNRLNLVEPDLFVFNVKMIEGDVPVSFETLKDFIFMGNYNQGFPEKKLKMVPVLESGDSFQYSLEQLITLAGSTKYANGAGAEGIVVRSQDGLISFKVMNNNYLIKNGE